MRKMTTKFIQRVNNSNCHQLQGIVDDMHLSDIN